MQLEILQITSKTRTMYVGDSTVKLGIKELLNKEQIGFKELFTD